MICQEISKCVIPDGGQRISSSGQRIFLDCETCGVSAQDLPRTQQVLLWSATDEYIDWNGEGIQYGEPVLDALENELFSRVCSAACAQRLSRRLSRYLDSRLSVL
jgi:hypothetical protein